MLSSLSLTHDNLQPNTIVRQPYPVTMGQNKFDINEMRVMLMVVKALQNHMVYSKDRTEVQRTILGDLIIHLPTASLLPTGSENYLRVRKALRSLREKTITIKGRDEKGAYEVVTAPITSFKYYLNNRMVEVQVHREILPEYLALAENYSQFSLYVAFGSSSVYTMKLYQYVSHWKDKTKKAISLNEIRELLQLEEKYKNPKDIRKRILEPVSQELKTRADVWFEVQEPIKEKNATVGYLLKIYRKAISPEDEHLTKLHSENLKKPYRSYSNYAHTK